MHSRGSGIIRRGDFPDQTLQPHPAPGGDSQAHRGHRRASTLKRLAARTTSPALPDQVGVRFFFATYGQRYNFAALGTMKTSNQKTAFVPFAFCAFLWSLSIAHGRADLAKVSVTRP